LTGIFREGWFATMKKGSEKEKNVYLKIRKDELGLTREKASDLLQFITPERLEKIESEKSLAHPDEVLVMSEKYKKPDLCNYYCANQCPIGRRYVPEITMGELPTIVLQMLSSLNETEKEKDRLVEIAADGKIGEDELKDFVHIQNELEKISITVETLQLWAEKMVASGAIDMELYRQYKEQDK
jgi:hypothetical protein